MNPLRLVHLRLATGALGSALAGCSAPVTPYAPAQLVPVPAVLPADSTLRFASSGLCRGLGSEWDSALVVVAYQDPATVRAFAVSNYGAVRRPVQEQEYTEGTTTLLFAKGGRYTGYCVFPPTVQWVGFVNSKATTSQLAWLTPQDCGRLSAKGNVYKDGTTSYWVRLATPQPSTE